jgi:hypothetical protein
MGKSLSDHGWLITGSQLRFQQVQGFLTTLVVIQASKIGFLFSFVVETNKIVFWWFMEVKQGLNQLCNRWIKDNDISTNHKTEWRTQYNLALAAWIMSSFTNLKCWVMNKILTNHHLLWSNHWGLIKICHVGKPWMLDRNPGGDLIETLCYFYRSYMLTLFHNMLSIGSGQVRGEVQSELKNWACNMAQSPIKLAAMFLFSNTHGTGQKKLDQ